MSLRRIALIILFSVTAWLISDLIAAEKAVIPSTLQGGKQLVLPYYEDGVLKAAFLGKEVSRVQGEQIMVTEFHVDLFKDGNEKRIELSIEAPQCLFDRRTFTASSAGPIRLFTPTSNYVLQGVGFLLQQTRTNSFVRISNQVHTVVQRGTNALATNAVPMQIDANSFELLTPTNRGGGVRVVTYRDNVRVTDPDFLLTSRLLRAEVPVAGRSVQRIVAEQDVTIVNKQDGSKAVGQHALYGFINGREIVELTGTPSWSEGARRAEGKRFLFDRASRLIRIEEEAFVRWPKGELGNIDLFGSTPSPRARSNTNGLLDIRAGFLEVQLRSTNRPNRRVQAWRDVAVISAVDDLEARGEMLDFNEAVGELAMRTNAFWRIGQRSVRGNEIIANRVQRTARVSGNAKLRFAVPQVGARFDRGQTNSTNWFVELGGTVIEYRTNLVWFSGPVHGELRQDQSLRGTLDSGSLVVELGRSNQVQALSAEQKVAFRVVPDPVTQSNLVRKELTSDRFFIGFNDSGGVGVVRTEGSVHGIETRRIAGKDVVKRIDADRILASFMSSNRLEHVFADRDVRIQQGANWVFGTNAVYQASATSETVEVTGNPLAFIDRSTKTNFSGLLVKEAEVFTWDLRTEKFKARPYHVVPISSLNDLDAAMGSRKELNPLGRNP